MRYLWQHAGHIIDSYKGETPLHHFLKGYYRRHPKLGSRDRRALSDMSYAWYRCSKAFPQTASREEIIRACLYLCGLKPKALESQFPEAWDWNRSADYRISILADAGFPLNMDALCPYDIALSAGIARDEWLRSMPGQPLLFLRIRKERAPVAALLQQHNAGGQWLSETCLGLPNGTDVAGILPADAYVVQDASSQATGDFFKPVAGEAWWDCCSGAGGKSLLLKDREPHVSLLVSDVRESILQNLRERFRQYHYPAPETVCLDMGDTSKTAGKIGSRRFDAILCDVPCTGSGTWARTPEQLYFFRQEHLSAYAQRQEAILSGAVKFLKEQGRIIYITCSVFHQENEQVVEKVAAQQGLLIEDMKLINGIPMQADSLFVAVLRPHI